MRLHDLARAAAAFTLAWAAFAQLPGKSHDAVHDGAAARAWPISRPRIRRPALPPQAPASSGHPSADARASAKSADRE